MNKLDMLREAMKGAKLPVEIHATREAEGDVSISMRGTLIGLMIISNAVVDGIVKNMAKQAGDENDALPATILAYKQMLNETLDRAIVRTASSSKPANITDNDTATFSGSINLSPGDMENVLDAIFGKPKA